MDIDREEKVLTAALVALLAIVASLAALQFYFDRDGFFEALPFYAFCFVAGVLAGAVSRR